MTHFRAVRKISSSDQSGWSSFICLAWKLWKRSHTVPSTLRNGLSFPQGFPNAVHMRYTQHAYAMTTMKPYQLYPWGMESMANGQNVFSTTKEWPCTRETLHRCESFFLSSLQPVSHVVPRSGGVSWSFFLTSYVFSSGMVAENAHQCHLSMTNKCFMNTKLYEQGSFKFELNFIIFYINRSSWKSKRHINRRADPILKENQQSRVSH